MDLKTEKVKSNIPFDLSNGSFLPITKWWSFEVLHASIFFIFGMEYEISYLTEYDENTHGYGICQEVATIHTHFRPKGRSKKKKITILYCWIIVSFAYN